MNKQQITKYHKKHKKSLSGRVGKHIKKQQENNQDEWELFIRNTSVLFVN